MNWSAAIGPNRQRQEATYRAEGASVRKVARLLLTEEEVMDYVADVGEGLADWTPAVYFAHGNASYSKASRGELTLRSPEKRYGPLPVCDVLHEIAHHLVGPGHGHDAVWLSNYRQLVREWMGIEAWAEFSLALNQEGIPT